MEEEKVAEEELEDEFDDDEVIVEEEKKEPEVTVEELQKRIDELAKEKDGIYKEMMSERRTRQELKGQVDTITKLLGEIKERKGEEQNVTVGGEVIPVKFDDDGNAFIDPQDLAGITAQEVGQLKQELSALKDHGFSQSIASENAAIVNKVVMEDPDYQKAGGVLARAYAFLDNAAGRLITQTGRDPKTMTLDDAIDMLESSPDVSREFQSQFPGLDIETVVEAQTAGPNGLFSSRKLRKALRSIKSTFSSDGESKLNNLKLIAGKPNNLAGQRNQKGATGKTLNDVAELSLDDFENMSDADIKRLERALERMED